MNDADEVDEWLAPLFRAMTTAARREGRTLGNLIEVVAIDGDLDWVALGQLMRVELGWDDYPPCPRQLSETR